MLARLIRFSEVGNKSLFISDSPSNRKLIVFVHGFACTADVFERQYTNPKMLENLHIVRAHFDLSFLWVTRTLINYRARRFDTTCAALDAATFR